MDKKYSNFFIDCLINEGYDTCFFVAGGNSMHLLEAARHRLECVPVVHELTATIATEYYNEHSSTGRAFAMVTAGPGLTNTITGIAGAWLESRELLVVGGQVKSTDLKSNYLRQRGIQEIGGVELVSSITKASVLVDAPISRKEISELCRLSCTPRKGPVFLEICLDVQAQPYDFQEIDFAVQTASLPQISEIQLQDLIRRLQDAKRPIILIGGGVDRKLAIDLRSKINSMRIPVMTSWNGADRFASDNEMWFGRPDTWGMRFSNILIQQADLVISLGARLGLQQTGFNWQSFVPNGSLIQVDLDTEETSKGHPDVDVVLNVDANSLLESLVHQVSGQCDDWIEHCLKVKKIVVLNDPTNVTAQGYLSPHLFVEHLSELCDNQTSIVPCSSGGANTIMMQNFLNKTGQIFFNNKALASMGYGLAGAIGAAIGNRSRRVVLVEGDGGFSQNSQDLATVVAQDLNLKIFIFSNQGYASIRMTQRNYFGGEYMGCDIDSGLGFPNWEKLADAYGMESVVVNVGYEKDENFLMKWNSVQSCIFIVNIDPEQTYLPKISSRITASGGMESAPLHEMTPPLTAEIQALVDEIAYLPDG